MASGIRVIRGPDWSGGDKDGGDGHVGTVVKYDTKGSAQVLWDNGTEMAAKIGQGGKFELRVLDNATIGVRHSGVFCDSCGEADIAGIRWQCGQCDDFDLCSICYATDKHDIKHIFLRHDRNGVKGAKVAPRNKSMKVRAMGIYPGATVVRGKHWEKGNEDGGSSKRGTVDALITPGSLSVRGGVTVHWEAGGQHDYRVGQDGKVDLKFVDEGQGIEYYPGHLPNLDGCYQDFTSPSSSSLEVRELRSGDRVCIDLNEEQLKQLHKSVGSWSSGMGNLIGQVGEVTSFAQDGNVNVEFGSQKWRLLPGALKKVVSFSVGDTVRLLSDPDRIKLLQEGHGGWVEEMKQYLGKCGRIAKVDSDGDVAVTFGRRVWLFNPECCMTATGEEQDEVQETPSAKSSTDTDAQNDLANLFMAFLKHNIEEKVAGVSIAILFKAILEDNMSKVRGMLEQNQSLVRGSHEGVYAIHLAAHEGKLDLVKLLIEKGADKNVKDNEGDTPLHVAIVKKKPAVAEYLIKAGVDINKTNNKARQPIHNAAYVGMASTVRLLVAKGCDVNTRDSDGDTPIFDGIGKEQLESVEAILASPKLDLKITNKRGFTPIHMTAFKGSEKYLLKILQKDKSLVNLQKDDGFTPLHLAAFNDNSTCCATLIDKGHANMEIKNVKGHTPLHLACEECYMGPVKVLVEKGADVNSKSHTWDTPLHVTLSGNNEGALLKMLLGQAPRNQDESRVRLGCYLIQHRADVRITNKENKTPLDVCKSDRVKQAIEAFSKTVQLGPTNKEDLEQSSTAAATPRQTPTAAANPRQSTTRTTTTSVAKKPSVSTSTSQRTGGGAATKSTASSASQRSAIPSNDGPKLCLRCMNIRANAVYLPCGHKETCRKCCTSVRVCSACGQDIKSRVSEDGKKISDCVIQ